MPPLGALPREIACRGILIERDRNEILRSQTHMLYTAMRIYPIRRIGRIVRESLTR
jgi:hypothetical protein